MVLVNTHPDYLLDTEIWSMYAEFLESMKKRGGYWHALPREVARWWRGRAVGIPLPGTVQGQMQLGVDDINLDLERSDGICPDESAIELRSFNSYIG